LAVGDLLGSGLTNPWSTRTPGAASGWAMALTTCHYSRLLTARWQLALGLLAAKDPGAAKAQLAILAKQTTDPKLAEKAKKKLKTLKK